DCPQSLDWLFQELNRQGLPPQYVRRVVRELKEHQDDLRDEGSEAALEANTGGSAAAGRLGDPQQLADTIASSFRARHFSGRHPIWAFVVAPIPLVLLGWIALWVAFLCLELLLASMVGEEYFHEHHGLVAAGVTVFSYLNRVVPSAMAALVLCRLARRSGRTR